MEKTTTSFGFSTLAICCLICSTSSSDSLVKRLTPGFSCDAAQAKGIPLDLRPYENTITLPFPSISMMAGRSASNRSLPAPEYDIPAFFNVSVVSASPEYPQSSKWLLASEQKSILTLVILPMFFGCMR